MIQHTPFVRKLTYAIGFSSIILGVLTIATLLVYQTWFIPENLSCDQWLQEVILPQEIDATISEVVATEDSCKYEILLTSGQNYLYCVCQSQGNSILQPQAGMLVKKAKNELKLTICLSPDSCATYQFPCCD